MCFALALRLKKRVREVENWPISELREWNAFFVMMDEDKKD